MNIKLLLKISLNSLIKHKGRSFLTILGIVVGIGAIISTLAIGYGAEAKLRKRILAMGNNFIFINASSASEGKTTLTNRRPPGKLTETDIQVFKNQCPQIKYITPVMFTRQLISYHANNVLAEIKCGNQEYLDVVERKIGKGKFFSQQTLLKNKKVIILGSRTAQELFGYQNPIGQPISINKIIFTVTGVLKKIKNYMGISDPNLDNFMPITTAKKYLLHTTDPALHGIAISAKNMQDMATLVKKIKKILRFRHRLEENEPDDFTIYDQQAMVKAAKGSSGVLNLLLLIIASISLLVGGIGVMNIMLVSVSERTKEIGLRMALGATTQIILRQFIFESITLCIVGGIIGIVIGIIIPYIVSIFTGWIVVIKLSSIFIAFLITTLVGLAFGFYPAKKASDLNPVEALQDI